MSEEDLNHLFGLDKKKPDTRRPDMENKFQVPTTIEEARTLDNALFRHVDLIESFPKTAEVALSFSITSSRVEIDIKSVFLPEVAGEIANVCKWQKSRCAYERRGGRGENDTRPTLRVKNIPTYQSDDNSMAEKYHQLFENNYYPSEGLLNPQVLRHLITPHLEQPINIATDIHHKTLELTLFNSPQEEIRKTDQAYADIQAALNPNPETIKEGYILSRNNILRGMFERQRRFRRKALIAMKDLKTIAHALPDYRLNSKVSAQDNILELMNWIFHSHITNNDMRSIRDSFHLDRILQYCKPTGVSLFL